MTTLASVNSVLVELDTISKSPNMDSADNLKELLQLMPVALDEITSLLCKPELKSCHGRVKLCASQISKSLPHLVNEFSRTGNKNTEIITHLIEKLRCCLMEMTPATCETERTASEMNFVAGMDTAIALLTGDRHTDQSYKELLDDLLCHALTIAKLSCPHDYNEITSACKNVLSAMSTLMASGSGTPMYKDCLLSALETLERRVNTGVLRLVLHTLSEPLSVIRALVKKCSTSGSQSASGRKRDDLEELISGFDLHSDRVHLIGNFAISCSENKRTVLAVESCLASLEFCENYLIPAVVSFYLNFTNWEKRTFLKFLVESWQSEVLALNSLLDEIIDTPAFVQVTHEDLCEFIDKIKESFTDETKTRENVNIFLKRTKRILAHINRSTEEDIKNNSCVLGLVKELSSGLVDLHHSAANCHWNETNVMQRLESIVSRLDLLSQNLNRLVSGPSTLHKLSLNTSNLSGFSESVKDLPFDVSTTSKEDSSVVNGMNWLKSKFLNDTVDRTQDGSLIPYFNKANEKSVLRSFYGKTPNRSLKIFQRDILNVTSILDNLSGADNTFGSDRVELVGQRLLDDADDLHLLQETPTGLKSTLPPTDTPTALLTSSITNVTSSERLNDIDRVEDKINKLKFHIRI